MKNKSKQKAIRKVSQTESRTKPAGETGHSFGDRDMKQIYRGAGHWLECTEDNKTDRSININVPKK